jgi:hypothetical protein
MTMAHEFENEAKRTFGGGMHPDEPRHHILVPIAEVAIGQHFPVHPLMPVSLKRKITWCCHLPNIRASNLMKSSTDMI